jgi:NAD(P)-dependent dehydrogenase (short-subunit alcohol dehydrogenase family)
MSSTSLNGKTALVTGGSRGIGRGIAERLAADGAHVLVHYATRADAAEEVVAGIRARGGSAEAVGQPLGAAGAERALAEQVGRPVDILVNNAGVAPQGGLHETTEEVYDELFAVNTRAPFFLTQAFVPTMPDGGRVVTISSGVTQQAWPNLLAYTMTKAAIEAMSRTLAKELAPRGITVNAVQAGLVDTDMNAGWMRVSEEARAQAAEVSAFGRIGEPRDVADVVAFLAADDARFVTGQTIDATGGSLL